MAFDAFLRFSVPGPGAMAIEGETYDSWAAANKYLEISSFAFGIENKLNITSASGGAGAGKAQFKPFEVNKQTDLSSTALIMTCCQGGHYDTVELALRKSGATQAKSGTIYLQYSFKMVAVGTIDWSGASGDDVPVEKVVFEYGAIQMSYCKQLQNGSLAAPKIVQWSKVKNDNTFAVQ